jgi:hypothetical protein
LRQLPLPVSTAARPSKARRAIRSDNAQPILLPAAAARSPAPRRSRSSETLPTAKVDALSSTVQKVADVHSRYMGMPLADRPTFLRMVTLNQIERDREGSEWGFATWPTIAMSGSIGNVADSC